MSSLADGSAAPCKGEAPVSIIVVSRERPEALRRCLMALEQQFHRNFEVIVVADAAGCAAAQPFNAKITQFDAANISAARNAGIALAAGEIIAFLDDDAVAEPGWLTALCRPFEAPEVAAAGGYVLGRNGISWQWRARELDTTGKSYPLDVPDTPWSVPQASAGRAIRLEGTNMAFRAEVLRAMGGFDPAFRFYHDETDLCWRMHLRGHQIAIVPGAVVHHGFLPSVRRRQDRMPRDLSDIGRGTALFLIRYAATQVEPELAAERAAQRRRVLFHMRAGRCMPGDVDRLLAGFDQGAAEAKSEARRPAAALLPLTSPADAPFLRFCAAEPVDSAFFAGRKSSAKSLKASAKLAREQGKVATLLLIDFSPLDHKMRFDGDGIWVQSGGQFGRSDRRENRLHWRSITERIRLERQRLERAGRFRESSE